MKNVMTRRFVMNTVAVILLTSLLTACIPLIVGGAVVGGTLVANDRRTSGAQLEDEGIELRSSSRIRTNVGDRVHVNVSSYNRQVLLTGEVPTAQDKLLDLAVIAAHIDMDAVAHVAADTATTAQFNAFVFKLRA